MIRKFTLLAALILVTISIFAQQPLQKSRNIITGKPAKSRFEIPDKSTERNALHQRKDIGKRAIQTKSALAVIQRLDSYSSEAYDAITSQWIPDEKADFIYNANLNLSLEYDYVWDNSSSQLVKRWKTEFTYDANGNLVQELYTELNSIDNQYYATSKDTYTYDLNGNQLQSIYYEYDASTSQFIANRKSDNTYDAGGNRTQVINYDLDASNQLVASWKSELTFNGDGNETQNIDSYWDGNAWNLGLKYESTYNSSGNKTIYSVSFWMEENSNWDDPQEKYEYSYNANGKLTQELQFTKDPGSSIWVPRSKDDYMFDASGNNTQHISYSGWDEPTSKWTNVWKEEYTVNSNFTNNELILPDYFETQDLFMNMVTEIKEFTWNIYTLAWNEDYRTTLAYSEQNITSVKNNSKNLVSIYPNPFTETISINAPASYSKITLEMFDQQGQKLFTKQVSSNEKLSFEGYNKGMYLYRLNIDGKIQRGKLLKE